ncbi:MAG: pitrilysin family protein, partial [Gammaproteobacteria bacterium]
SFADQGAIFSTQVSRDMATLSLRSLTAKEYLKPTLDTFTAAASQPRFDNKDLQREKQRQLVAIEDSRQSPMTIANEAFYQALYASGPYARPVLGESQSIESLSVTDVETFYKQFYVANNAMIVIVGDVSPQVAQQISEQISTALASGKAAAKQAKVNNDPKRKAITEKIDFPATQTTIRMGQVGISYDSPDYMPLTVGNYTLGEGMFVSRLMEEVREQRGLSYYIGSRFSPLADNGPFAISLSTENRQTQEALTVVRKVLQEFVDEGPTDEELQAAKKFLSGNFSLLLDSNAAIAGVVLNLAFYERPLDYLDTYLERMENVTRKDIVKAFQKHIEPDKMTTILVGKDENS